VGVNIVETCLDVEEECRDPELGPLEGPDLVSERQADVQDAKTGEGAALIGVKKASGTGKARKSDRHDSFQDFGHCF